MSRSLTDVTPEEIEVVRRAQREMMGLLEMRDGKPVRHVTIYTVPGPIPSSIKWLHEICAMGAADSYNYHDRTFTVRVQESDRHRDSLLASVDSITLHYREPQGGPSRWDDEDTF